MGHLSEAWQGSLDSKDIFPKVTLGFHLNSLFLFETLNLLQHSPSTGEAEDPAPDSHVLELCP